MARTEALDLRQPQAFRAFYDETLPIVFGYFVGRCGGDRAAAEDLTQETYLACVRAIRGGTDVSAPRSWLMGIARHKLIDHYRSRWRDDRRVLAAAAQERLDPPVAWDVEDVRDDAIAALGTLPVAQRAVLVLHHVEGLPIAEVARALHRSEHAVESLLARGRTGFRHAYRGGERCLP